MNSSVQKLRFVCLVFFIMVTLLSGNTVAQELKIGSVAPYAKGRNSAKYKFEVFFDYQCSVCGKFDDVLSRLSSEYPDSIEITYRHYPLCIHQNAFTAARAIEAAGRQGQFFSMRAMLFERRAEWASEVLPINVFLRYAKSLDLDEKRFSADYDSEFVMNRIQSDIILAWSKKLAYSPVLYVNGEEFKWTHLDEVEPRLRRLVRGFR